MILGIRYLTGYCVARDLTRQEAEWPPHPARVFMAMAAAHFQTGADPNEREALLWLERQPAPKLSAGPAVPRTLVESYVPVNDQHGGISKRPRQPRSLSFTRPASDSVYLFWGEEPETPVRTAIEALCAKVTRIGHSSSLAQMWVPDKTDLPLANWQPDETNPQRRLRLAGTGLLQRLEQSFNQDATREYERLTEQLELSNGKIKTLLKNQIKERFGNESPTSTRPVIHKWGGYQRLEPSTTTSAPQIESGPFNPDFIVLSKFDGRTLGLESTLQLTQAMRDALLRYCPKPQPEWLTGHAPDGSPSKHPHVAIFPLAYVGGPHADGHVMGLGIAVPKELYGETHTAEDAIRRCMGPVFYPPLTKSGRKLRLWRDTKTDVGKAWEWHLEREVREDPPLSLKPTTWVGPAKRWASVTPVVLHHYPKKNDVDDIERILRAGFKSALLPDPESIEITPASPHVGAGSIRDLPPFSEGEGLTRFCTHVVASFSHPVTGPMLVGRGRYRGYGLFRPLLLKSGGRS